MPGIYANPPKSLEGALIVPTFARFLVARYGAAWREQLDLVAAKRSYHVVDGSWRGRLSQGVVHGVIPLGTELYHGYSQPCPRAILEDGYVWINTGELHPDPDGLEGTPLSGIVDDPLLPADATIVKARNFGNGNVLTRLRLTIDDAPRPLADFDPPATARMAA